MQLTEYKYVRYKSFTNDWIRTADLWCRERLLYQLSHNHCPIVALFILYIYSEALTVIPSSVHKIVKLQLVNRV